ncbi:hypothetical protein [Desulfomarina sp.]
MAGHHGSAMLAQWVQKTTENPNYADTTFSRGFSDKQAANHTNT